MEVGASARRWGKFIRQPLPPSSALGPPPKGSFFLIFPGQRLSLPVPSLPGGDRVWPERLHCFYVPECRLQDRAWIHRRLHFLIHPLQGPEWNTRWGPFPQADRRSGVRRNQLPRAYTPRATQRWSSRNSSLRCVNSRVADNHRSPWSSLHFKHTALHTPFLPLPCAVKEASVAFSVTWEGRRKETLQVWG